MIRPLLFHVNYINTYSKFGYFISKFFVSFIFVFCFSLFVKSVTREEFSFSLIGNIFQMVYLSTLIGTTISIAIEKNEGNSIYIFVTPTSPFCSIFFRVLGQAFEGGILFMIALIVFGYSSYFYSINGLVAFLIILVSLLFSTLMMGVFIGLIGYNFKDPIMFANLIFWILILLGGINFPTERLPFILEQISFWIPLNQILKGFRLYLLSGHLEWVYILREILNGTVMLIFSLIISHFLYKRLLKSGNFDI